MKNKFIISLLILSIQTFGQSKFVGEYIKLLDYADTLKYPKDGYLFISGIKVNSDSSFFYYEEENPRAFETSHRETLEGSWISRGDTLILHNRKYLKPKGVEFKYVVKQNFKGIKIVVKNLMGHDLDVDFCAVDSLSQHYIPFFSFYRNTITINNSAITTLYLRPKGFCSEFRECAIEIPLEDLKDGTLVEATCYSTDMEMQFDGRKYILSGNVLKEYKIIHTRLDPFAPKFMRKQ